MSPTVPTALKALYYRARYHLSDEVVTYELDGARRRFLASSYPEFRRFQSLMGEDAVLRALLSDLEPDDVFFDVGANVGTYACFAAGRLDGGRVVAFEPEPANAARLEANADRNGLDVDVRRIALSDADGTAHLERAGTAPGGGEHALADGASDHTIEVAQRTGDGLVEAGAVPVPTVVKIDVEGAELKVLEGLAETLARDACRLVYCEVHPDRLRAFGGDVDDLEALLTAAGFEVTTLARLGEKHFLRAEAADGH